MKRDREAASHHAHNVENAGAIPARATTMRKAPRGDSLHRIGVSPVGRGSSEGLRPQPSFRCASKRHAEISVYFPVIDTPAPPTDDGLAQFQKEYDAFLKVMCLLRFASLLGLTTPEECMEKWREGRKSYGGPYPVDLDNIFEQEAEAKDFRNYVANELYLLSLQNPERFFELYEQYSSVLKE